MTTDPHARRPGAIYVGDVVVVTPLFRVTNLGEGVVVDLSPPLSLFPVEALVRFKHGPATGTWYSVGMLKRLRDLKGEEIKD